MYFAILDFVRARERGVYVVITYMYVLYPCTVHVCDPHTSLTVFSSIPCLFYIYSTINHLLHFCSCFQCTCEDFLLFAITHIKQLFCLIFHSTYDLSFILSSIYLCYISAISILLLLLFFYLISSRKKGCVVAPCAT